MSEKISHETIAHLTDPDFLKRVREEAGKENRLTKRQIISAFFFIASSSALLSTGLFLSYLLSINKETMLPEEQEMFQAQINAALNMLFPEAAVTITSMVGFISDIGKTPELTKEEKTVRTFE